MKYPLKWSKAKEQIEFLLTKRLQGSKQDVIRQISNCLQVIKPIHTQFGVGIYQLQQKHLIWYLDKYDTKHTAKTRNNHWYSVLRVVETLGKDKDWVPRLNHGPWIRPNGDNSQPIKIRRPHKKATAPRKVGLR